MNFGEHARTTGNALRSWFLAQIQDALAVGALWLVGLLVLHVPLAPLWAILAAVLQFIPHIGPVLSMIGPALTGLFTGGWERMVYVLILYAVVVVIDGLVLQPLIMKRTARVPIWASILVPLAMGIAFGFWGILLAPPLLAIVFAYRNRERLKGTLSGGPSGASGASSPPRRP